MSIFLKIYGDFSGQYVNNSKSSLFTMDTFARFVTKVQCLLSCSHGTLPFNYLRVPIFVGAPKFRFLQPLVDKVKLKLSSWKGKSLSMMGRIQLVNMVITGFLSYSFNIYKWLVSILKQVEQWNINFIWTCDIMKKDITTFNWAKIFSPLENDALKIINLLHENNAYLLKLSWNFSYSNKAWFLLLKAKVLKSKYRFIMVYSPLFGLRLNSFMTLFLNILIGLLVHAILLIFGVINVVQLLLYQSLQGYLMVLESQIQFLNSGLVVIGVFPCHYDICLIFLNISWLGRNMIFLIGFWKILGVSLLSQLKLFSWILEFPVVGVNSFGLHIYLLPKL